MSRDNRDVVNKLLEYWRKIPKHIDGSILGSMTTWPHWIAVYAYNLFIHSNLADPVIFKETAFFEEDLVHSLSTIYKPEEPSGFITSGGTESNIISLYIARKIIKCMENVVVAPITVHTSIRKACDLLSLKLVEVGVDKKYRVNVEELEEAVRKHKPLAIVVTAGTTDFGSIDYIREVGEIASRYKIYLHVDAAYGGLLIPFIDGIKDKLLFYEGVSSISLDFHKNGLAPIPAGLILFRNRVIEKNGYYKIPYMPARYQKGLLGTRPGASAAAMWSVWNALGVEGFRSIALRIRELALYLYNRLSREPFYSPIVEPELGIVSFSIDGFNSDEILPVLWRRKLFLYRTSLVDALRVAIMPHITRRHIDKMLAKLSSVLEELIEGAGG